MKAVIGIDPGNQFGLAVVSVEAEPRLLHWFSDKLGLKRSKLPSFWVRAAITAVDTDSESRITITRAVIEDQYLPRGPRANIDTAIKIGRNSGRWQEACEVHGISVEFIKPASWQHAQLKGLLPNGARSTSKQRKVAAVSFCRGAWGEVLSEDAADAACMARVVAVRLFRDDCQVKSTVK